VEGSTLVSILEMDIEEKVLGRLRAFAMSSTLDTIIGIGMIKTVYQDYEN